MRTHHRKTKIKNILSLLIIFMIICFWNSEAFSLDMMGPPAAGLEYGMFETGVDFSNSEMDIELYNGIYTDYIDNVFYDWGEALDVTLKDLKINRTYVQFAYGVYDNAEVFARLGGANAKFGDSIWENSEKFDSGTELAAGAGVKLTFFQEGNLKIGTLFQFNTGSFDGQLTSPYLSSSDFVKLHLTEVQLAVGASCQCNENLTIYGGPFLHFVGGDISDEYYEIDSGTGGLLKSKFKWDIEQDSALGGYIGAQINFAENCSFNLEYQQTSNSHALGMNINFKF